MILNYKGAATAPKEGTKHKGKRTFSEHGFSLATIRSSFKGQVLTPEDDGYDKGRVIFYGGYDRKPAIIVRVADAEDVKGAISLARESGLELAVRSGGHSVAGFGLTDGGIVLDLRDMHALQIDTKKRTAWAETGLTTGEYTSAADSHGLATGFGDTGSVGIGGITLGGGVGYLARKHGLTIDQLLAAEIVTADGQLQRVDAENLPDLFWAIRGGGGNFGVATRFQFRLHKVGQVFGGMIALPATVETISGFIAQAEAAAEELSTIANVMAAPPMPFLPPELHGKLVLMAMMLYSGKPDQGVKAVAPFRKLAQPLVDMLRPMRYPEMFPPEPPDYHPTAVSRTLFQNQIGKDSARTILEYLNASDAPLRVAQLRVLGGAVRRVSNDDTAYAHRENQIMVNLAAFYTTPEEQARRQEWVNEFARALPQDSLGEYVNFMTDEGEAKVHDAYPGETWDRLVAIKTRYDPGNLFRLNQNIPPKK